MLPHDAVLRTFWWLVLGGFVMAVGILICSELGLSVLLRFLARDEDERRTLLARNSSLISGQSVWLILLGGAVVGAWWPLFHATLFSGLWIVLLFIAIALLVGPVAHASRFVVPPRRLKLWDSGWGLLSLAALLVLGMGVGTTISGVPMHFTRSMDPVWGSFVHRFTPYDVLIPGLMAVSLGVLLAAARATFGTQDVIARRAQKLLIPAAGLSFILFVAGAIWATQFAGYAIGFVSRAAQSSALGQPLHGTVFPAKGAYIAQYLGQYPLSTPVGSWPLLIVPVFAALCLLFGMFFAWRRRVKRVWPLACLAVIGIVATAGATTFPIVLPFYSAPSQSFTVWNGSMPFSVLVAYLVWLGVLIPVAVGAEFWARRRGTGLGAVTTPDP